VQLKLSKYNWELRIICSGMSSQHLSEASCDPDDGNYKFKQNILSEKLNGVDITPSLISMTSFVVGSVPLFKSMKNKKDLELICLARNHS